MVLEVTSQRKYFQSITGRIGGEETTRHLSERSRTCTGWHKLPWPEEQPSRNKHTQHFYGIGANILVIIIEIYHSYDFLMQGINRGMNKTDEVEFLYGFEWLVLFVVWVFLIATIFSPLYK